MLLRSRRGPGAWSTCSGSSIYPCCGSASDSLSPNISHSNICASLVGIFLAGPLASAASSCLNDISCAPASGLVEYRQGLTNHSSRRLRRGLTQGVRPRMESMSHVDYIATIRAEAGDLAADVLGGRADLLGACHRLSSLLAAAELEPGDEDAKAFMIISSEIDALPVGADRTHWDSSALSRLQPKIDSTSEWARKIAEPALVSVIRRFKA